MKATIISAVLMVMASANALAQQKIYNDRPNITVSGDAVVYVKPDKAVMSFGIETRDDDIQVAKQKNNDIFRKTINAVKECGIPEKNIQTDQLSITPNWSGKLTIVEYRVYNTITVTLSEVEKLDKLISSTVAAGVNRISGPDFQTTEFKKYREQARELALKAAKEKADKMAAVFGQTIGGPIHITEGYSEHSRYRGMSQSQSQSQSQALLLDRGDSDEASDTVALGKLPIRASVSVIFELKN
jgi:uncharacterized protein YggE